MVMVKTERQVGFILSLKRQNNHQNKTATEKWKLTDYVLFNFNHSVLLQCTTVLAKKKQVKLSHSDSRKSTEVL